MSDGPVVNERIAQRRAEVRAGRRARRLRRTVVVATLAALVLGLVALERTSLVALDSIEVVGLERLDEATVLEAAAVSPGTSVLRIRTTAVEERVTALPLVVAASVERVGALGLRIEVDEADPALTARFGDVDLLVSASGLVLGEGLAAGTPLVVVAGRPPRAGASIDGVPALAAAHEVVLALPGPLAALVDEVRATAADAVELHLETGVTVRWGGPERADEKARALGAVLQDLGTVEVTVVDVRAPSAPTVTP